MGVLPRRCGGGRDPRGNIRIAVRPYAKKKELSKRTPYGVFHRDKKGKEDHFMLYLLFCYDFVIMDVR